MTGVEQQSNLIAGMGHQIVHILCGLNHRPHMVMISNLHSLLLCIAGERGELLAILRPARLRESRTQVNRRLLFAVNAMAHLSENHHFRPQLAQ